MATDRERVRKLRGERSRRQRVLPRIQRDTAGEVTRLLRRAERDIRATLAGTPSEFDAFTLPRLQTSIRQALERMGAAAGAATAEAAARAWDAGIETVDAPLNAALQLDTPDFRIASMLPTVDTRQLTAMRAFVTHKMTGISTALADRINAEIGLVAVGTTSAGDAVGRIAGIMKTGGAVARAHRPAHRARPRLFRCHPGASIPGRRGSARPEEAMAAIRQASLTPQP